MIWLDYIIWGLILFILIGVGIIICRFAITLEEYGFNNGYCPRCGEKLHRFDYDSHGCRGYKCSCGYETWVSYKRVDKNFREDNNG